MTRGLPTLLASTYLLTYLHTCLGMLHAPRYVCRRGIRCHVTSNISTLRCLLFSNCAIGAWNCELESMFGLDQ
ncbi:hypothetical protein F4778DRAFT_327606 [Xylariomycetidae sp. FL2044]|nr:hypothetical protein F4778DRAFT_327606 [Xylariomycetidae sp. FL2044]